MSGGPGEQNIEEAVQNTLESGQGKIIVVDENGNIVSDVKLSEIAKELAQSCILTQALSFSNTGTATADYTVLSSDLSLDFNGTITIQILLSVATTAQVKLTPSGSTDTYTGYLNGGSDLAANSWYEFEFNVNNGDSVNFVIQVPAGDSLTGLLRLFKRTR